MLTKEQLRFLRKAKKASFTHRKGEGLIAVTVEHTGIRNEYEILVPIPSRVRSSRTHLPGEQDLEKVANCHVLLWVDSGDTGLHWRTIMAFLKPGDEISLQWGRDYETNGYMEKANLHGDRLTLKVKRGEKLFGFIVNTQCSANNTARMVRRGADNNE